MSYLDDISLSRSSSAQSRVSRSSSVLTTSSFAFRYTVCDNDDGERSVIGTFTPLIRRMILLECIDSGVMRIASLAFTSKAWAQSVRDLEPVFMQRAYELGRTHRNRAETWLRTYIRAYVHLCPICTAPNDELARVVHILKGNPYLFTHDPSPFDYIHLLLPSEPIAILFCLDCSRKPNHQPVRVQRTSVYANRWLQIEMEEVVHLIAWPNSRYGYIEDGTVTFWRQDLEAHHRQQRERWLRAPM